MARFHFRAVASSGEVVEGEMEASDQAAVVAQLRGQGHLPLAAEPVGSAGRRGAASALGRRLNQPLFGARRVGRRQLAVMTRELATLLESGLTLDQSLRLMSDLVESEAARRLLGELLERVRGGSSLADALAERQDVFSNAYVSMVRAGEAGGSLDEVLARLAGFLEQAEVLSEQVKSALVYPVILLIMAGISIIILLTVVVPEFEPLFQSAEAELPWLTRLIIGVGEVLQRYWWALLLGLGGTLWIVHRQFRQPASRARIDAWLLRTPLLGELLAKVDTARFARTLGTLLGNGVPLLSALSIVKDTLANASLRDAVAEAATGVKEGRSLAEPLERTAVFPKLAVHLLSVGEKSGRLEPMLIKIAEIFDREVRGTIERLMALLVPVLTILLGLVIASIIGAVLMAILSAYQLPL